MLKIFSKTKTEQQVIDEIHNEFDSAQDRLLSESKEILSKIAQPHISQIEQQAERLSKLGFTGTPIVEKAKALKLARFSNAEKSIITNENAQLISYYKNTYPFLKFLTQQELDRICNKYSLIYAPVKNFIKDVPDKNIREIELSQPLKSQDNPENITRIKITEYWTGVPRAIKKILDKNPVIKCEYNRVSEGDVRKLLINSGYNGKQIRYIFKSAELITEDKSGLFICAPENHFNLKGLTKSSILGWLPTTTVTINDPIVFRYCRGGVQALSKWGLEANDSALVLPINN